MTLTQVKKGGTTVFDGEARRVQFLLTILSPTFITFRWPTWVKYALTVACTGLILWFRIVAEPVAGSFPILFFFISVLICAILFDRGSGLLAAGMGTVGSAYLGATSGIPNVWLGVIVGGLIMAVMAVLIEFLRETSHQLIVQNESLSKAEREKDILIRENAHRVRNDLTIFSSMIRLQQARLTSPEAKVALAALNDRLLVLLRVHQRLRIDANATTSVDAKVFLQDLCDELRTSLIGAQPITLRVTSGTYWIVHKSAVSLGIIVNELVTNALKYAYPEGAAGEVRVDLVRSDRSFVLTVEDDGRGNDGITQGTGLGGKLIQAMARQLEGSIEVDDHPHRGWRTTVTFSAQDVQARD